MQAAETATLVGVLVDLAERGDPVRITVGDEDTVATVHGLGADFVAGTTRAGLVLVPYAALDAVCGHEGASVEAGRAERVPLGLAGALDSLAADRPQVTVRLGGTRRVTAELTSVGQDVIHLRETSSGRRSTWVRLDAVRTVTVLG